MKYPTDRAGKHFSHRFVRLLFKVTAAQQIGADGVALLTCIVMTEDAARYRRPVSYFNEQLMSLLGFAKWDRLKRVRDECVRAGWLAYDPPPNGTRKAGTYFVTVPSDADGLPDGPIDEGTPQKAYPENGDSYQQPPQEAYPNLGDAKGEALGEALGEPPTLSLTLSHSCPPSSDDPKVGNGKPRKKPTTEESPEFVAWYAAYPRREGRGAARKAYATAIGKLKSVPDPHRKLLDSIAKYSSHVADRQRNHIKTPAAWLNGEHWADELDSRPASVKKLMERPEPNPETAASQETAAS